MKKYGRSLSTKVMALVLIFASPLIVSAVILLQDDFSDSKHLKTGDTDGNWYHYAGTQTDLDASSGILMVDNSGSGPRQIDVVFGPAVLGIGDTLTLKFDIRLDVDAEKQGAIRFGLFDSKGSSLSSDTAEAVASPRNNDNVGYWANVDSRAAGASKTAILYNKTAKAMAFNSNPPTVTFTSHSGVGVLSKEFKTVVFSIKRSDRSEYKIGICIGDGPVRHSLHSGGGEVTDTFDTFSIFSMNDEGVNFSIDNVIVSQDGPSTVG